MLIDPQVRLDRMTYRPEVRSFMCFNKNGLIVYFQNYISAIEDEWQERTYSRVLTERAKSQSIASSKSNSELHAIHVI
jgi:hypothetical protein